jgi:hypothetical protein
MSIPRTRWFDTRLGIARCALRAAGQAAAWLPSGCFAKRKYSVLYLLHGPGANQSVWMNCASLAAQFGDLIADDNAVRKLVVKPSSLADERAAGNLLVDEMVSASADASAICSRRSVCEIRTVD